MKSWNYFLGVWVFRDYDAHSIFRTWHNRLKDQSEELLHTIVVKDTTEETNSIIQEVQVYLKDSFGNSTRIDYGTGHEMTFVMFLACLFHAGVYDVKRWVLLV